MMMMMTVMVMMMMMMMVMMMMTEHLQYSTWNMPIFSSPLIRFCKALHLTSDSNISVNTSSDKN